MEDNVSGEEEPHNVNVALMLYFICLFVCFFFFFWVKVFFFFFLFHGHEYLLILCHLTNEYLCMSLITDK